MTDGQLTTGEPMALFGGTFDPVHYGHLRCADEVRKRLALNELFLLPAGVPPHRDTPGATVKQRLDMLQLARQEFPRLLIDDRETRRNGPSYMVDTLTEIRSSQMDRPLVLLIGQDAANQLHTWFEWERLFGLTHIIILTRPDTPANYPPELAKQIQLRSGEDIQALRRSDAGIVLQLQVESIDISATDIKRTLRSGGSAESMLPAAVLNYVIKNRLYLTS